MSNNMRKLLVLLFLFCALKVCGAGPVFLGTTADYVTNRGGTIAFVFSNRTEMIFTRGAPFTRITNSALGTPIIWNFGQGDTSSVVRLDFSFGNSQGLLPGYIWELAFNSNSFYFTDGNNKFPLQFTRDDHAMVIDASHAFVGDFTGIFGTFALDID